MKNYKILTLLFLIFTSFLFAQEDKKTKNEKVETITKTTTIKGVKEETTVIKTVKKEDQIINIKDTGSENQDEEYSTKKNIITSETKEVKINTENEVAKEALKKAQEKEIEESREAQLKKYEEMKKEMEKKKDSENDS